MKRNLQTILASLALAAALLSPALGRAADDVSPRAPEPVASAPTTNSAPSTITLELNAGDSDRADNHDLVTVGGDATVLPGEQARSVFVVFGSANIDGLVLGDVFVINGTAKVNGTIRGNLFVLLGSAKLGPQALLQQEALIVGGPLDADSAAQIRGQKTVVKLGDYLPRLDWLRHWVVEGLLKARPLPPQVGWVWGVAGAFLVLYLLLALVFRRATESCAQALQVQPIGSFFTGLLVFLLTGPLLFLLTVSIIGLVVVPFLLCALVAAALFGRVAVYRVAGGQLGARLGIAALENPFLALLLGAGVFTLLYMVPVLGFLLWGLIMPLGVGAAVLAAFGIMRKEKDRSEPGSPAPGSGGTPPPVGFAPPVVGAARPAGLTSLVRVGFWRRTWATAIDLILIGGLASALHWHGRVLPVWLIYHVAMWAWRGTTVGGVVLGLKIVRTDGRPLDFPVALIRSLATFLSGITLGLGFFAAGWSRERQSWHDKIAGTIVVRAPKDVALI